MTVIKGILFDKDGTLFDFAATWEAWAKALLLRLSKGDEAQAKRAAAAIAFDLDAGKFHPSSIAIAGTPSEIVEALAPHFPDHDYFSLLQVIDEEATAAPQEPAVPLTPLLSELRARGLRLGVATNDSEAPARAHLGQADVVELFDFIAGFDSGFGGKPAPGQLLAFAEAMDLAPTEVVMVGDSPHDLHAGRAAGMTCIGVLTGGATEAVLAPLADVVLPDIGGLPNWLDRRAPQN